MNIYVKCYGLFYSFELSTLNFELWWLQIIFMIIKDCFIFYKATVR